MPDAERQKVIARAKERYGLAVQESDLPDVVLDQREQAVASTRAGARFVPVMLATKSIDDLKRWVGRASTTRIPLQLTPMSARPAGVGFVDVKGRVTRSKAEPKLSALSNAELVRVRQMTLAYLQDTGNHYVEYKVLLERYWKEFKIPIWLFNNITVGSGSVLEISGGATGVLLANNITIQGTGKLVARSTITIDARTLIKS